MPTQELDKALTKAGIPEPKTGTERVVQDVSQAISGGGGLSKLSDLVKDAELAKPFVLKSMKDVAGLVAPTMAGSLTREAGGGPVAQTLASLVTAAGMAGAPRQPFTGTPKTPEEVMAVANAKAAQDAGFVVPPQELPMTPASKALMAPAGKPKTEMVFSAYNQENFDKLAKREFGLPEKSFLNEDTYENIRTAAGKSYEAARNVQGSVFPDGKFLQDMKAARDKGIDPNSVAGAVKSPNPEIDRIADAVMDKFMTKPAPPTVRSSWSEWSNPKQPQLAGQKTTDIIDAVKQLRHDATADFKKAKVDGDPHTWDTAVARRNVADALDDLLDRRLREIGPKGRALADQLGAARQTIAKSYNYEAATNTESGHVSGLKLAKMLDKDVPLSGNAETSARFAKAFPRAARAAEERTMSSVPLSRLDWGALMAGTVGGVTTAAMGHPGVGAAEAATAAAAVGAGPLARNYMMSDRFQDMITQQAQQPSFMRNVPLNALIQSASQQSQGQ
jgi:hypothetical protein